MTIWVPNLLSKTKLMVEVSPSQVDAPRNAEHTVLQPLFLAFLVAIRWRSPRSKVHYTMYNIHSIKQSCLTNEHRKFFNKDKKILYEQNFLELLGLFRTFSNFFELFFELFRTFQNFFELFRTNFQFLLEHLITLE